MNVNSVAHSYVQNQQPSSWIDDPFQLGTHAFKGLKPMSHQRNLDDYIQELVGQRGKYCSDHYELTLWMLTEEEQNHLVHLYIESIDREIEWACYGEDQSINSDYLCAMLAMLKDSNPKTRANFAQVTTRNLIAYYKKAIQKVLDTACHDLHCSEMNEAGYHSEQDMEHGDFQWRKY